MGNGLSAGKIVKYDPAVGLIAVTFIDRPVAPVGIVQLPFVPHTGIVYEANATSGVDLGPMTPPARVSITRHGVIGTNDDAPAEPDADADNNPPPATTASTAPKLTQRDRNPSRPDIRLPILHDPTSAQLEGLAHFDADIRRSGRHAATSMALGPLTRRLHHGCAPTSSGTRIDDNHNC